MDEREARRRVDAAPVGRLATVRPDGTPHVVPICFAVVGNRVVSAVDEKPKTTPRLQRLANVAANPAVTLLVDHYEDDWTRIWWVRADGRARVVEQGSDRDDAVAALRSKYGQYERVGIPGAVLLIEVDRWSGWTYAL